MQEQAVKQANEVVKDSQSLTALLVRMKDTQDRAAFAELFEHFAPRVKSYVLKLGSDEAMAEEIAQLAMVQVWRKSHLFDENKAAASTWIFRIARNLRLDQVRKEKHFDYAEFDMSTIEDTTDNPEEVTDRMQHSEVVRSALSTLPPEQMDVVNLSFYEGLSHGDIAERLGLPLGTVKSRMRLAFKRIRNSVEGVL